MTQEQIDKAVAKALLAREIIAELRAEGLLKDSYAPIFNASLNSIVKKLKKTTPKKEGK